MSVASMVVLAALALVVGTRRVRAQQARRWRFGWSLLGVALILAGVTQVVTVRGYELGVGSPAQWVGYGASFGVAGGLAMLVRHRASGRAVGFLLEALIVVVVIGYVAWVLASASAGAPPRTAGVLAQAALDAACVWVAMRLITMGPDRSPALRFLVASLSCRVIVDALTIGAAAGNHTPNNANLAALSTWTFCLAAATAIHPSLRQPLALCPVRDRGNVAAGAVVLLGCVVVVPGLVGLQWAFGVVPTLPDVLVGATLLPAAVVVYLSHQVHARARAAYKAQHDPLTGLANRNLFEDQLNLTITQARRTGGQFGVMFLDLDRFKTINDSLGHAAGNQLLQSVAARLRACVREHDTVARFGGDEFTLLIADIRSDDDCAAVANKVLHAFSEPFVVGGRDIFSSTSIGIATYPEHGSDSESMLKYADTAMYRAKARGRNGYEFYTSDMSARANIKLSLENSLHNAIQNGELLLHYQPQVDLRSGHLVRLEALARWNHPKLGSIAPSAFIPLAEESGLIRPLGEWALEEACRQLKEWSSAGLAVVPVAVNVSAEQLCSEQPLDALVERVLTGLRLPAHLLEVEVTESVLMGDIDQASATLQRLRDLGVRLSIDDFGTGYSGLAYLAQMPIDSLKIDRSFVEQVGSAGSDQDIVIAVIALAHSLGMQVIAEGVETFQQADRLRELDCDEIQGYLVRPPLPADKVPALLGGEPLLRGQCGDDISRRDMKNRGTVLIRPTESQFASALAAICRSEDASKVDPDVLATLLAMLQPHGSLRQASSARVFSTRLAAGTFAGLVPLSTGLAAAGALPAGAQQIYSVAFADLGIPLPNGTVAPPADAPQILAAAASAYKLSRHADDVNRLTNVAESEPVGGESNAEMSALTPPEPASALDRGPTSQTAAVGGSNGTGANTGPGASGTPANTGPGSSGTGTNAGTGGTGAGTGTGGSGNNPHGGNNGPNGPGGSTGPTNGQPSGGNIGAGSGGNNPGSGHGKSGTNNGGGAGGSTGPTNGQPSGGNIGAGSSGNNPGSSHGKSGANNSGAPSGNTGRTNGRPGGGNIGPGSGGNNPGPGHGKNGVGPNGSNSKKAVVRKP